MRDKGVGALVLLLIIGLIGIIFSGAFGRLVATVSGQMDAFAEGILFYIDDVNYGPMMFNLTFTADQFYFTDDFMMITSMKRQWGELGFSVSPASANLTVTSVERDITTGDGAITFVVDYEPPFQSTTRIYIGKEGRPSSVSGAASWSYNSGTRVLTIKADHNSPQEVVVEWVFLMRGIRSNVFRAYAIMGLAVLLLGAQLALAALSGNVTLGMVVGCIFTSIFLSIGLVVLAAIMGAF